MAGEKIIWKKGVTQASVNKRFDKLHKKFVAGGAGGGKSHATKRGTTARRSGEIRVNSGKTAGTLRAERDRSIRGGLSTAQIKSRADTLHSPSGHVKLPNKSGAELRQTLQKASARDRTALKRRLERGSVAQSHAGSSNGVVQSYTQMRGGKRVTVRGYRKS